MFRQLLALSVFSLLMVGHAMADKTMKIEDAVVVSASADNLAVTDPDGKNARSMRVDSSTSVMIDGKPAKLPELVKGDRVKIAIDADGKVVRIAATRGKK